MACINSEPVNNYNFLRWFEAFEFTPPAPVPGICGAGNNGRFTIWDLNEESYQLPAVYNDVLQFYINAENPLVFADFADLRLGLLDCGRLAVPVVGTLTKVDIPGGYRIAGAVTIPDTPDGVYNLAIYRQSTKAVLLVSNALRVINFSFWNEQTKLIKYRNAKDFSYFDYEAQPDFYNVFRVDIALNNEQTPVQTTTFTDTFTGQTYNAKPAVMSKTVMLESYAMDKEAHTALAAALTLHSEFYINNIQYFNSEGYERENEESDNGLLLANGRANLTEYNFMLSAGVC